MTNINNAGGFLVDNNNIGLFGNAHGTAQVLKALNIFYTVSNFPAFVTGTGSLTLTVNGVPVQTVQLTNGFNSAIIFDAAAFIRNN